MNNGHSAQRQAAIQHRLHGSINRVKWAAADIDRVLARFNTEASDAEIARLLAPDVEPTPDLVSTPSGATEAPVAAGKRSYTFTISTPAIDSYGDSINPDGWKLDTFRSNPVVLWGHDSSAIPIGRATKTWLTGKKLKSTVELAPASANPAAEQVRQLIDGGFLRASSVGFMPLKWSFTQDKNRPFGIDFQEQLLLEWSIVTVPANSDCLVDAGQVGKSAGDVEQRRREARQLAVGSC